jgi:hypothetical protein
MQLPNRQNAYVPPSKFKRLFTFRNSCCWQVKSQILSWVGFDESNIELLERGLLALARNQEVNEKVVTPHGTKYVIDGSFKTPIGKSITIRTVWIIDKGNDRPRFVTAMPN